MYSPIEVFPIRYDFNIETLVTGSVVEEGYYSTESNFLLSDLVAELDLSEDVYKYVAILQSSSGSHLFSLIDESTMNIKLSKNALIKFFSISDIKRGNNLFGNLNNESIDLINAFTLKIYGFKRLRCSCCWRI